MFTISNYECSSILLFVSINRVLQGLGSYEAPMHLLDTIGSSGVPSSRATECNHHRVSFSSMTDPLWSMVAGASQCVLLLVCIFMFYGLNDLQV